ncbi:MAG: molybdopterin biosynthesis protein [Anaerolineae bacterium]|nr:molybdopterin biosynthesis protein [Anaerolineae bacterium]
MSVYLHDIPLDQAQSIFLENLQAAGLGGILGSEEIPLDEHALGRVLAETVWARLSSPHYHAAAMDGFAVRAEDTYGASPSTPITLKLQTQTVYVDTGDPMPNWANAVVPIEQTEPLEENGSIAKNARQPFAIRLRSALPPWTHVRPMGEDIIATQLVLPAGQVLRPVDLGALAACGQSRLLVSRKPRVGIIPTGNELVEIGKEVQAGDIIEYNSIVLAAQVQSWGGLPHRYPIVRDDFDDICQQVQLAANENDLVLLNAGSSAGSEDFSARVVDSLGKLLVHGVAVRPGHPVILGMIRRSVNHATNSVPVIGVPGYPVSAALTGEIFVEPLLARWLGRIPVSPPEITATLTRKLTSPPGDTDFVRVVVGKVGDKMLAAPISRGAGVITSLVRADGIAILEPGIQGLDAGSVVNVRLYRPTSELERTIFAIGSHDMSLDLLAQELYALRRRLVSSNVGSLGGLIALKRQEAHLAGSHLLDPQSGEYNISYIRQYLPEVPISLVVWVHRQQGLLVLSGNPKKITSLQDLARADVQFINRQKGSGTRVLLDYHLQNLGIKPNEIRGYELEEYTHLGVAAAVVSGRADCGLGITAAAKALGLDFIPLFAERYDFVIPRYHLESPLLSPIFDLMRSETFRQKVNSLPGYDASQMGTILLQE